jgi:hypothetical protein
MVSGQSSPYPTYYMSKLVSRFAAGGDQVVTATSNYNLMAAYGAKRSDGGLSLLLINKSATTSLNASINLAGFQPQSNATVHSYGIPQDEAARTGAGSPDIATSAFAGAGASFVYTVAPYSATVISLASAACPAGISPANQFFTLNGGDGQIAVAAPSGCNWTAASNDSWIVITSSESGSGNGVVNYTVRENFTGNPRQGSITIGGQTLAVIQDSKTSADCQYVIDNSRKSYASNGGSGTLTISTEASCAWAATSSASWLTFTSTNIGIGNGVVAYSVAPNAGPSGRKTTITIAGKTFTIKQK